MKDNVISTECDGKEIKIEFNSLAKAINSADLAHMFKIYRKMVINWAREVSFALKEEKIICPIALYNEVSKISTQLELINEYQKCIEHCAVLQGIIETDMNTYD